MSLSLSPRPRRPRRPRRSRALGAVIAGALAVAASTALPAPAAAADPANVLVIGDSISQGTAGDFTWRYRLARSWATEGAAGPQFIGARTALFNVATNLQDGNHHYLDPSFNQRHDAVWGRSVTGQAPLVAASISALPAKPQAVVVELGTNDFMVGAANALASMRTLIAGVRQAAPGAAIVLAKPYAPYSFKDKTYANVSYTAQFGAGLDALAAELTVPASPVTTSDLAAGFDAAQHTWDGAHPSPDGEIKIAKAIGASLSTLGVGGGYVGPGSATWAALGPAATATLSAGRITVAWPDSTPGVLAYALEQRRRTAADPAGSWIRVGTLARGIRSWTSPVFPTTDSFDYRLVPVRGVMEGVAGPTVTVAATTASPPPSKEDPVKPGAPTPPASQDPLPSLFPRPAPTTPAKRVAPKPAATKVTVRSATARRVGTGMRVNLTFTSSAACPATVVVAVRTSGRVTLKRARVPVKKTAATCTVAASVKLTRKVRARGGLKVLVTGDGLAHLLTLAKR